MRVEVIDLRKTFGTFQAVRDVSFTVEKGRLVGLLGPSGGGKTSILRMLAGLETPDAGDILFDGRRVNDVPPQERGIGFVFQSYALFRHMTVKENIAFGLEVQKWNRRRIRERVAELIELTGLGGMEKRYPRQLSGGQRQRVAFARALAPEPQLLLLDEPFAAIDAKIRQELRRWLRELIDRVGVTSIFVTHDQEEAIEVADEIMIINQGRLEQKGTPREIYSNPQTSFVAEFIGESMLVSDVASLRGFEEAAAWPDAVGLIRPEYVEVGKEHEIALLSAAEQGKVVRLHFRGNAWMVEVDVGPHRLITYRPTNKPELAPGEDVRVLIHRIYMMGREDRWMMENRLKSDPMPVNI